MRGRTLLLSLLLAVSNAAFASGAAPDDAPRFAAEEFLALIDASRYDATWSAASEWLRTNVDAEEWAEHAGRYRESLGEVESRVVKSVELLDELEEMPEGRYAFVTFDTTLADGRNATELVGLVLGGDNAWRVIGYQSH